MSDLNTNTTASEAHPSFKLLRRQHVDSLNIDIEEYQHTATGSQHIHLSPASDSGDTENVFLVALRTVPHDSRGVAHILEHTALCGSKKYPVRDPFFMMTRRSLNTFMNAFTSSDWTAYPFASMNRKDFSNLTDVYLDAVFFSRLDELDFAQEGHRLEFKEHDNSDSALEYKGVVYNEMKGAMSSVPAQLWQSLCKYLYPTTTYHHNSGGDPESIPDLTYEQLLSFYRTHYHPSNAIFMTYGDISAAEHQTKFEAQALKHFEPLDHIITVEDEKRYHAPVRVQEYYPNNDGDNEPKTHVVLAWLLGHSTNLRDSLRAQLLSSVLLDNSACPLMHTLETTELGSAPSPLCGLDDSQKELSFSCGLAGCETQSADEVEALIRQTLEKIADEGIPANDLEAAVHQLELHQREVGGDSYPYGLQLILTALTNATHRGDPIGLLNIDGELAQLREDVKDPEFVKTQIKNLLLNNQHCVRLTMVPDSELAARTEQAELAKLAAIKQQLSPQQSEAIVAQAKALKARQAQEDDESILPKVTLADVPKENTHVNGDVTSSNNVPLHQYQAGTNGLVYQQVIYQMPELAEDSLPFLPLYSSLVCELGAGDDSYIEMQRQQASVCGGLGAFSSIRGSIDDCNRTNNFLTFSGKALNRNQQALSELMHKTISSARFDEHSRLQELIAQIANHQEQSVTRSGHALAMTAASAGISAAASLSHRISGLAGIQSTKALNNRLNSDDEGVSAVENLAQHFSDLHHTLIRGEKQILLIAESNHIATFNQQLGALLQAPSDSLQSKLILPKPSIKVNDAWLSSSPVNYCAKAYATVSMAHDDSAALTVLGDYLRNGFLHTAIRERGGAYGGGASQDSNNAAFRFYSYRDPRLDETLNDFDQAIDWLSSSPIVATKLEEAILGIVSSIDKSESPAGRAKRCFHSQLHGRTADVRQDYRERILATTGEDLQRVAALYLQPKLAHVAVISDHSQKEHLEALGMTIKTLT
ncbi:MAG: peptidase M16 [Alteromonadaceae bacterium]|nr:MAG: peptidase M16 [Alteromonadaceae bacterium]